MGDDMDWDEIWDNLDYEKDWAAVIASGLGLSER
jgi:hypothetical protein